MVVTKLAREVRALSGGMVRGGRRKIIQRRDPMQEFADRIVEQLELGVKPWVRPWSPDLCPSPTGTKEHAPSGDHYHGIDVLILGMDMRGGFEVAACTIRNRAAVERHEVLFPCSHHGLLSPAVCRKPVVTRLVPRARTAAHGSVFEADTMVAELVLPSSFAWQLCRHWVDQSGTGIAAVWIVSDAMLGFE
jgi:hypothetical protein